MATGISLSMADAHLAGYDNSFVQLHTGDPGAAGTANVSASAPARKAAGLGAATTASGLRRRSNASIIRWEAADVASSESGSHASFWSAASGGTFRGSIPATVSLVAGQPAEIAAGAIAVTIGPVAS